MTWNVTDRFPSWGETGSMPADGFFYEQGDQVNEKHLDALWNGIDAFESETRSALSDIDSDKDGIVDAANAGAAPFTARGDIETDDGTPLTIWDDSNSWIPVARLEDNSVTVAGNSVTLGNSTPVDLDDLTNKPHSALDDAPSSAHHARYTDEEAQDTVGGILGANFNYDDASDSIDMSPHAGDSSAHHSRPSFGTDNGSKTITNSGDDLSTSVSFSNTYKHGTLVANFTGGEAGTQDDAKNAGWESWNTDGDGNITGATIGYSAGTAFDKTLTWHMFGEIV